MIKVGVLGAKGRMGSLVSQIVRASDDLELVAEVDIGDQREPLAGCDVVVDFTSPAAVMDNLGWCLRHGRDVVIGTSGFDAAKLARLAELVGAGPVEGNRQAKVLVVPNFSVGAVLMMKFAEQAARFFDSVEIIELHHAGKIDAPSGTAARTAAMVRAARDAAGLGPSPDATTSESPGARGATIDDRAIRGVSTLPPGLTVGLDSLLGLPA